MSDPTPVPAPPEPTVAAGPRRRRGLLTVVVAAVVVVLLSGGAFATYVFFFGGGPRPDEVLPASTVAVVSLDLNPSGSQKLAALDSLDKFPALSKALGLKSTDDVRRSVFEKVTNSDSCSHLNYQRDVQPWLGDRIALAAVDLGGKLPVPALAVQISDPDQARAGFDRIVKCADLGSDFGYVVGSGYVIGSDSTAHAAQILKDGATHPLATDAGYKKWTGEAGEQGVLNFYVAKKAAGYLADQLDGLVGPAGLDQAGAGVGVRPFDPSATKALDSFEGLAGTVRFAGGGLEVAVAAGGLANSGSSAPVGASLSRLPQDTALAFGFGIPSGYAAKTLDNARNMLGASGGDAIKQAEAQSGLKLPEDLQTLLGSALTLSLGGTPPADLNQIKGPGEIPFGLVLHTDVARAKAVIAKAEARLGFHLSDIPLLVRGSGTDLVLSPSSSYAAELLGSGSLGSAPAFNEVVPQAARADFVLYADFTSPWRDSLIKAIGDSGASPSDLTSVRENTDPLKALGVSSWVTDRVSHVLVKVTTR